MKYPLILFLTLCLSHFGKVSCQTPQWNIFESDPFAGQMVLHQQDAWISTIHGLVQVNINSGQKTIYTTINSGLNNHRNAGISVDSSGRLWILSGKNGLYSRTPDNNWQTLSTAFADTSWAFGPPATGSGERVYLFAQSIGSVNFLMVWENDQLKVLPLPPGFSGSISSNIISDKAGGLWLSMTKDFSSTAKYLLHSQGGSWEVFSPLQFDANVEENFNISWMAPAPDGSVFIQTHTFFTQSSIKNKVFRIKDGQIQFYQLPYLSLFENYGACTGLAVDKDSHPWFASKDNKIWRFNNFPDDWTPFDLGALGIPSSVGDIRFLLDAQERILVLGPNELYITDGMQQATVTSLIQTEIQDYNCWGLTVAPDGKVWFGGGNGPSCFKDHQWTLLPTPWGSEYHNAANLEVDAGGNLWYLPLGGSFLTYTDGQQFVAKELLRPDGFTPYQYRSDLDIDLSGNKWVCTGGRELLRVNGNQIKYYVAPEEDPISRVAIDASGKVWAIGKQIYQLQNDVLTLKYNANFLKDQNEVYDAVFQGNRLIMSDWRGNIYRYNGISLEKDSSLLAFVPSQQEALYPKLATDSKGNLWAATYSGLFQRTQGGDWLEISTRTSPIIDNFVSQITTDACDNVWLWAYDALMVYNPDGIGSTCGVLGTHSAGNQAASPLRCWPNPAVSQVNISAGEQIFLDNVQVLAENGACVLMIRLQPANTLHIPVQGLASGWYTALARDQQQKIYQARFFVNR